jgi:secreted trypsin-like serine protease
MISGEGRISGGEPTTISKYPFAAALLTNSGTGSTYLQRCGGTIITSSAILSAASCYHTNRKSEQY